MTIDDEPESLAQTKKVIDTKPGESILSRLPLCVEISLKTVDGDIMILEVWSLSCNKQLLDKTSRVSYSIYNRMGTLLKSLVQVTRSTPAYKLSRKKSMECYDIFYRIYSGSPQIENLGTFNTNSISISISICFFICEIEERWQFLQIYNNNNNIFHKNRRGIKRAHNR